MKSYFFSQYDNEVVLAVGNYSLKECFKIWTTLYLDAISSRCTKSSLKSAKSPWLLLWLKQSGDEGYKLYNCSVVIDSFENAH